jgi:hypothetical protein
VSKAVTWTNHIRSRRVLFATAVSTLLLVASMVPFTFAAERTTTTQIGYLDRAICAAIIQSLRAHPEVVPTAQRAAIKDLRDTGCRTVGTLTTRSSVGLTATAAAATSCKYVYQQFHMYAGPIETHTAYDDAYVCWNGTKAWQQDYHHCYVTAYPLGFGESTACVRINNNTATVTLRNDFYVATYALPTYHRVGWMSYSVTKTGSVSGVSGFCCS